MSGQTLNSIAVGLVEQQRRVAKSLIKAVRSGNERAYGFVDEAWEKQIVERLPGLSDTLRSRLVDGEKKVTSFGLLRAKMLASGIDINVDRLSDAVSKNIAKLRGNGAAWVFDNRLFERLEQLSLPTAELSLKIAQRTADGVEKLAARAGGRRTAVKAAKPVKHGVPARKKAAKGTKKSPAARRRVSH